MSLFPFVYLFDSKISDLMSGLRAPVLDVIMPWITEIAGPVFITVICLIVIFFSLRTKRFALMWAFLLSVAGSLLVSNILKVIIERPRPLGALVDESGTFSFPSNHSVMATAAYGFLIFYVLKSKISKLLKILATTALLLMIILVGFSRLYLEVHYFSDILVGYFIGFIFAFVSVKVEKVIETDRV